MVHAHQHQLQLLFSLYAMGMKGRLAGLTGSGTGFILVDE